MELPTAEQILELAPKKSRLILLDANVIAYFGDLLIAMENALRGRAKATASVATASVATASVATASARGQPL